MKMRLWVGVFSILPGLVVFKNPDFIKSYNQFLVNQNVIE
jgi:hypothetical protein